MLIQLHRGVSGGGMEVLVATLVVVIVASLSVGARFVARHRAGVGYKADDWLIVAAVISAWAMAALRIWVSVNLGLGFHSDTLPHVVLVEFQKVFLAIQATYFTTSVLTKSSILLLYRRIFDVNRRFVYVVWVMLGVAVCYWIICFLVAFLGCHPISFFWNKDQPGSCINETQFFRWNGIANVIIDVVILLMPLPPIFRLQMTLRQKLALCGIFLIGTFACIASAFRIVQFEKSRQSDPTYTTVGSILWSQIEQCVGITCACLPTLRPLLRKTFWSSRNGDESKETYYTTPYTYGSSNRAAGKTTGSSNSRTDRWQAESESVVELALDPAKGLRDVSVSHSVDDDGGSDEEMKLPRQGTLLSYPGILKTESIEQHSRRAV